MIGLYDKIKMSHSVMIKIIYSLCRETDQTKA